MGTRLRERWDALGERSTTSEERPLSTEAVFETLSSTRRRYTLHYLEQRDEPVTIRELSEVVAAWENGIDRSAVEPKDRKRVYTALHQTHLPKMVHLGVVDYDHDRGTIALTGHVREFDIYLAVVPADDLPWSQVYLGTGAVLTALVTVAAVGVLPFAQVSGVWYALLATLTVTSIAAYHSYHERQSRLGASDTPPEVTPPPESREVAATPAVND